MNEVSFYGPLNDVEDLKDLVKSEEEPFSFESVLPTPQEKIDDGDWYSWRLSNWGTKWDVASVVIVDCWEPEEDTEQWAINIDTAWGPPLEFFDYLAGKFSDVEITLDYDEPGMAFAGHVVWLGGVRAVEQEFPSPTAEAWADEDAEENKCKRQ